MGEISNEVFVIVTNRKDGRLPDPAKIINGEMHHDEETAFSRFEEVKEDFGDKVGLYRALISVEARIDIEQSAVEERQPRVTDLGEDQLLDLLEYMYRAGKIDTLNGADLSDYGVHQQVREFAREFIHGQLASDAAPRR